jgi:hypothetical protein
MIRIRILWILLPLWLSTCALAQTPLDKPCADEDKGCLFDRIRQHPAHSAAFWRDEWKRPLLERLRPAPPELVDYVNLDNRLNGYPERPRAAAADGAFIADLRSALEEMPEAVRNLAADRLGGIFLVDDLGGTGFTDIIEGADRQEVGGYVLLDAGVLSRFTANAWASWKENTPFKPRDGYELQARIEAQNGDNRKNAIQYILLHELAHVISVGNNIHPPWTVEPRDVRLNMQHRFFSQSWRVDRWRNTYVSVFDADFPQRSNVAYYFGAKLDAADMAPTYASLEKTNFASLYAATRPGDDFAESFASYVHVVLMGRPWRVTISHGGEIVKEFSACWDEPRCRDKRELLERILAGRY